jgi:serine phosphatase RsbU (regulator of sigma subunit)
VGSKVREPHVSATSSTSSTGHSAPAGGSPPRLASAPTSPPYRFLMAWALGWGVAGGLVGAGIVFTLERLDPGPILVMSIVFAEVVGFTALVSARVIFPMLRRLPYAVRLMTQFLTLFSGTLFGSAAILWFQPLFSLARFRTVVVIVLINATLAVAAGIALHTYDSMRRQIEASFLALRQKEALERDLEIAREVQRELLPRATPSIAGLDLAGVCRPAIGVGGDYFDYLPFGNEQIGLVIADVSGKGIPAALLMAGLQASVRSLGLTTLTPCDINRRLNEILHESTSASLYATFFFALYDSRARLLTYSNAGHHPPLLVTPDGAVRLSAGGRPIGILEGSEYGEGKRELGRGDLVALFTDGVVEQPNHADEEFGEDRLLRILAEHRDSDLNEIIRVVLNELESWSGGAVPHDDVTLVLARVR